MAYKAETDFIDDGKISTFHHIHTILIDIPLTIYRKEMSISLPYKIIKGLDVLKSNFDPENREAKVKVTTHQQLQFPDCELLKLILVICFEEKSDFYKVFRRIDMMPTEKLEYFMACCVLGVSLCLHI